MTLRSSRQVSLHTAIGAVAVFFCGIYAAHALTPGNPGVSPRTAFTVSGHLTGVGTTTSPGLSYTFHKGASICNPLPIGGTETYDSASGNYSVQLDYSLTGDGGVPCTPGFFDGSDITVDVLAGSRPVVMGQPINPVPYAQFAANAGSLSPSAAQALVPSGSIIAFSGTTAPAGWLLCNGAAVSQTTYAALYAAIGTANGSGGSPGMFNLPDLQGRFLRGVDNSRGHDPDSASRMVPTVGGNSGDAVGSLENAATAMPNSPFGTAPAGAHTHTQVAHSHGAGAGMAFLTLTGGPGVIQAGPVYGGQSNTDSQAPAINGVGDHTHSITGGDSETRPVNVYVNWIIKI